MTKPAFKLGALPFIQDPAAHMSDLRARSAVFRGKMPLIGKVWFTTTHAVTLEVVKNKRDFVLEGQNAGQRKSHAAQSWWMPRTFRPLLQGLTSKDDPDHRRQRKLVDQAFTRRGIRDMRGDIARQASAMLSNVVAQGDGTDLVAGFTRKLPVAVIADLLGVRAGDRERFSQSAAALGDVGGLLSIVRLIRAVSRMTHQIREMIADARAYPGDGLIAELVKANEDGDQLNDDELIAMIFTLFFAGFETTTNLIGGALLALEAHPVQRDWLLEDFDARIESATEELCRYVSAVTSINPRFVARDMELAGQALKQGDRIMPLLIAANYDPAVFVTPEQLQLDRFPNPHLAFSSGNHFCLGMQLARVELQEALRAFYLEHDRLGVKSDQVRYAKRPGHRAITNLPLAV